MVGFQDDEAADDDKNEKPEEADAVKKDEEKPAAESPEAKPDAEAKPDSKAEPDAEAKPAEEAKADDKPKVESFEDVKQQIAEAMVLPKVAEQIDDAMDKVSSTMREYFNRKAIYSSAVSIGQAKDAEAPAKPDLQKLAKDLQLNYEMIGPHDVVSLADEPISQSTGPGASFNQPGPQFAAMMYGVKSQRGEIPKQQLFSPLTTFDVQARRSYVSWKVEENKSYVPELDECREEVVTAIRMSEARDLARKAADDLVAQITDDKTLEDVIPEDKKENFKTGLGPFSWMNAFGFGGAFLGNVPELDSVGEEFMRKVFSAKPGEVGVAANLPERMVYIVRPTQFQPNEDDLRQIFKQPNERRMAMQLGVEDAQAIYEGFYESLDERTGFDYKAPEDE